jgi:hypothetical protein
LRLDISSRRQYVCTYTYAIMIFYWGNFAGAKCGEIVLKWDVFNYATKFRAMAIYVILFECEIIIRDFIFRAFTFDKKIKYSRGISYHQKIWTVGPLWCKKKGGNSNYSALPNFYSVGTQKYTHSPNKISLLHMYMYIHIASDC